MITEEIRSYEVSIWTLQDEFITVLKWSDIELKGRIQDPKMTLNVDGTLKFEFSIPMYIREDGKIIENPNWYNTLNGNLMIAMRKIKVIFNKGSNNELVYEFLILNVDETHEKDNLICNILCEGLAFHELGKIGYKYNLSLELFELDRKSYDEKGYWEDMNRNKVYSAPIQSVDYWCDKIYLEKCPANASNMRADTWYYKVDMDWSSFKNEPNDARVSSKVYEEDYPTSWDNNLNPTVFEHYREKARPISSENSNIYNITQTIAETFEIFCRYEYKYDQNYHIIGRLVIFYNNFILENKETFSLTYPYSSSKITRKMDGTNLTTKLYVLNVDDDTTLRGYNSIMSSSANKTMEDYILNFDYMKSNNIITDELYAAIKPYEIAMRDANKVIIELALNLDALYIMKPEVEAKIAVYEKSKDKAWEIYNLNNGLAGALSEQHGDSNGYIIVDNNHPDYCIIATDDEGGYYINLTTTNKGIAADTIHVYYDYDSSNAILSNEVSLSSTSYYYDYDEYGYVTRIHGIPPKYVDNHHVFVTYKYAPQLYYAAIAKIWEAKAKADEAKLGTQQKPGLILELETIEANIETWEALHKTALDAKKDKVRAFEKLMGPALREGYWQPEEYTDYGDNYTVEKSLGSPENVTEGSADTEKSCALGWDSKLFDDEEKNYYEFGATLDHVAYPCIDLSSIYDSIKNDIENYSFVFNNNYITEDIGNNLDARYTKIFSIGSGALLLFAKKSSTVYPILVLVGAQSMTDDLIAFMERDTTNEALGGNPRIGKVTQNKDSDNNDDGTFNVSNGNYTLENVLYVSSLFIADPLEYTTVYPRIKFSSLDLKASSSDIVIKYNNTLLELAKDYYITTRNNLRAGNYYPEYYITIKPEVIFRNKTLTGSFVINYSLSNANTAIYLDALEISKENAIPKVEYEITSNLLDRNLARTLYKKLAHIVMINDAQLKFNNVFGYISGMELNLDKPEEDTLEVKNYKTKFEDLFSTIVALTLEMKKANGNGGVYAAANGEVVLNEEATIETITKNRDIFDAYLDSHFDSSLVVRDRLTELFTEAAEILSDSNKTLNKMRGLTLENASILAGFAENITNELTTKVFRLDTKPTSFKPGDIWIDGNGDHWVATAYSDSGDADGTTGFVRTRDGTLASITGAGMDIDAEKGLVDIYAANELKLRSGKHLYIGADDAVDIVGNKSVNIGGCTINIVGEGSSDYGMGGINLISTSSINFANYKNSTNKTKSTSGGLEKAIADLINDTTNGSLSKVLIHPDKIDMAGADITIRGGNGIKLITSRGNNTDTSAISIDPDDGVYIGSGKCIRLFSGKVSVTGNTISYLDSSNLVIGASVELNQEHLIMGFANINTNDSTAIEMNDQFIIIAAGNAITGVKSTDNNKVITGASSGLVGAKFTKNSIGFATLTGEGTELSPYIYNAIIMNDKGITLGSTDGTKNLATTSSSTLKSYFSTTEHGSYVRISEEGIELGSLADLYINTDNFKLQTHSRDKGNNQAFIDGETILAIGNNLQLIDYDTKIVNGVLKDKNNNVLPTTGNNAVGVRLLVNKDGLYVKGNVDANSFTAQCTNGYFKATASSLGFYSTSDTGLFTIVVDSNETYINCAAKLSILGNNLFIGNNSFSSIQQTLEDEAIVESIRLYKATNSDTKTESLTGNNANPGIANSGTTTKDNSWKEYIPSVSTSNKYLWSVLRLKNGAGIYTYGVPVLEGVLDNLTEITYKEYARSSSNTTAPDINDDSLWSSRIPNLTASNSNDGVHTVYNYSNKYVWVTTKKVKVNGNWTRTTPVLDNSLTGIGLAVIDALNIASGATAVPHVSTTGISIDNGSMTIGATASLSIAGNHSISLYSSSANNGIIMNSNGISIGTLADLAIAAGGSFYCAASSLKLYAKNGSGKDLDETLTDNLNAAEGYAKDYTDGFMTGLVDFSKIKCTGIEITNNSIDIASTGTITIATSANGESGDAVSLGGGGIVILSGGDLKVNTSNMVLDSSATASTSALLKIVGPWTEGNNQSIPYLEVNPQYGTFFSGWFFNRGWMWSGTGSRTVVMCGDIGKPDFTDNEYTLNAWNTVKDWSFYCGNGWPEILDESSHTFSCAPFRVARETGHVYSRGFYIGSGPLDGCEGPPGEWYTGKLYVWKKTKDAVGTPDAAGYEPEEWNWKEVDLDSLTYL